MKPSESGTISASIDNDFRRDLRAGFEVDWVRARLAVEVEDWRVGAREEVVDAVVDVLGLRESKLSKSLSSESVVMAESWTRMRSLISFTEIWTGML